MKAFEQASNQDHYRANKQRILRFLIPIDMIYNKFPTQLML